MSDNYLIDEDDSCFDCEVCHDTGLVILDEDDGEGHTASGVISQPCLCRDDWDADEDDDEDDDYESEEEDYG